MWSNKVQQFPSRGKGLGIFAVENIQKDESILVEKVPFILDRPRFNHDMFEIIYKIYRIPRLYSKFMNFMPHSIDNYVISYDILSYDIQKLSDYKLKEFIDSFNKDELRLMCAKYMRNAYHFRSHSAILFEGPKINHHCKPNVEHSEDEQYMVFKATRDIKKGEEIFDDYTLTNKCLTIGEKHIRLLHQYGFHCECSSKQVLV